jgi:acyl carrier protein
VAGEPSARRQAVLDEIVRLAGTLDVTPKLSRPIREGDRLLEDLELDSMTLTALAVALEDHFRVVLTDAPVGALDTIGGLADYIAEHAERVP